MKLYSLCLGAPALAASERRGPSLPAVRQSRLTHAQVVNGAGYFWVTDIGDHTVKK
jgi:hypothetical protein